MNFIGNFPNLSGFICVKEGMRSYNCPEKIIIFVVTNEEKHWYLNVWIYTKMTTLPLSQDKLSDCCKHTYIPLTAVVWTRELLQSSAWYLVATKVQWFVYWLSICSIFYIWILIFSLRIYYILYIYIASEYVV